MKLFFMPAHILKGLLLQDWVFRLGLPLKYVALLKKISTITEKYVLPVVYAVYIV